MTKKLLISTFQEDVITIATINDAFLSFIDKGIKACELVKSIGVEHAYITVPTDTSSFFIELYEINDRHKKKIEKGEVEMLVGSPEYYSLPERDRFELRTDKIRTTWSFDPYLSPSFFHEKDSIFGFSRLYSDRFTIIFSDNCFNIKCENFNVRHGDYVLSETICYDDLKELI